MRDLRGTKDEHEREESEAERLVRSQPKLKPPRHDRRRERMVSDRDPDVSGDADLKGDPDLSLNYKNIGGSANFRRLVRLALGSDVEKVKVRNKENERVVLVSPSTLKEQGSKYEKIEDSEGEAASTEKLKAAPKSEQSREAPKPETPSSAIDTLPPERREFLDGIVKKHQAEQARAKKPKTLDEAISGLDVSSLPEPYRSAILAEQAKSKPKVEPESKSENGGVAEGKKEPSDLWPGRRKVDRAEISQAQSLIARALPAKVAAKFLDLHPDDAVGLVAKFKGYSKQGLFRDESDLKEALSKLSSSFTLDYNSIEPPETWRTSKGEVPFKSLSFEEQGKALSQHRNQVLAYSLAMRGRAIDTLTSKGISRAAAVASVDLSLKRPPESKNAEEHLSFYEHRREKVARVAKNHFISEASVRDTPPMSANARLESLRSIRGLGSDAQLIATAKVQASDLREVSQRYLTAKPSLGKRWFGSLISEREPASKIIAKVNAAMQDFDTLARDYPPSSRGGIEPKKVFRSKVLSRLKEADRSKYDEVRGYFAKQDRDEYDTKKARYEKEIKRYDRDCEEFKGRFAKWQAKKERVDNSSSPYRSSPAKKAYGPPPEPPIKPIEPKVPPGYLEASHDSEIPSSRKSRNEIAQVEERLGLTKRIVDKVRSWHKSKTAKLYSSYGCRDLTIGSFMSTTFENREAVYHGVEPDQREPYAEWEQAQACGLDSSDISNIVSAARGWLKSPVLAKSIEGMPRDARFRAALDLAIRDVDSGRYSAVIDTGLYNEMLSKLSGDHSDPLGTLGSKEASLVVKLRSVAAHIANIDSALAYELIDFVDRPEPVDSRVASEDTYNALRSTVIRVAAGKPSIRTQLLPALRLIKTIDDVRLLRVSGD